jgi:hypothetical protein
MAQQQQSVKPKKKTSHSHSHEEEEKSGQPILMRLFAVTWKEKLAMSIVGLAMLTIVALHIFSVVQIRSSNSTGTVASFTSNSGVTTVSQTPVSVAGSSNNGSTAIGNSPATDGSPPVGTIPAQKSAVATTAAAPLLVPLGQMSKPHVVGEYGVLVDKGVVLCYCSETLAPNLSGDSAQRTDNTFVVGLHVNIMSYQGSYYKKKQIAGAVTSLHFLSTKNVKDGDGSPPIDPRLFYLAATPPSQANPPLSDFRLLTPGEVAILNGRLPANAQRRPVLDLTDTGQAAKKELSFGDSIGGWLFFEYILTDNDSNPQQQLDQKLDFEFRFYANPETSHTGGIPLRVRITMAQLTSLTRL